MAAFVPRDTRLARLPFRAVLGGLCLLALCGCQVINETGRYRSFVPWRNIRHPSVVMERHRPVGPPILYERCIEHLYFINWDDRTFVDPRTTRVQQAAATAPAPSGPSLGRPPSDSGSPRTPDATSPHGEQPELLPAPSSKEPEPDPDLPPTPNQKQLEIEEEQEEKGDSSFQSGPAAMNIRGRDAQQSTARETPATGAFWNKLWRKASTSKVK